MFLVMKIMHILCVTLKDRFEKCRETTRRQLVDFVHPQLWSDYWQSDKKKRKEKRLNCTETDISDVLHNVRGFSVQSHAC